MGHTCKFKGEEKHFHTIYSDLIFLHIKSSTFSRVWDCFFLLWYAFQGYLISSGWISSSRFTMGRWPARAARWIGRIPLESRETSSLNRGSFSLLRLGLLLGSWSARAAGWIVSTPLASHDKSSLNSGSFVFSMPIYKIYNVQLTGAGARWHTSSISWY